MSEAVTLAVYDLSRGMAMTMSRNILGEQIEGIWHTGIRVFGKEWFYGGGIQVLPEGVFELACFLPGRPQREEFLADHDPGPDRGQEQHEHDQFDDRVCLENEGNQ